MMTCEETLKVLREGKMIDTNEKTYVRIEDGQFVERRKEDDSLIVKGTCFSFSVTEATNNKVDYKIYEKPVLDEAEKKYLSGVIRPFRKDYEIQIKKCCEDGGKEFITIIVKNLTSSLTEFVCLPYFGKDTMYKGMESEKEYFLKELGLC